LATFHEFYTEILSLPTLIPSHVIFMCTTVTAQGHAVAIVEEFVYLGSLIYSTTLSSADFSRRNAIVSMPSLGNHIWK